MASQSELEQARAALHKLLTGRQAVRLERGDRVTVYQPSEQKSLESYISRLEGELGETTRRRGPARVSF